jgi:hypothetical protein
MGDSGRREFYEDYRATLMADRQDGRFGSKAAVCAVDERADLPFKADIFN